MSILTPDIPDELLLDKYAGAKAEFMDLNGIKLHYRDQGNRGGEVIVCLHGSQSSLHTWEGWVEQLKSEYRLITIDLPGHGFSSPMPHDDYSYAAITALLHRFIRRLRLPSITLVGNSYGGTIAIHYANWYAEDLSRLVLIDSTGFPDKDPLSCRIARWPGLDAFFRAWMPAKMVREELESCYGDPSKVTDTVFNRYYELMLREGNRRAQLLINKPATAYQAPPQVLAGLHDLPVPALIMWGEKDPWIPTARAEQFARTIPDSYLKIYRGVGHLPMEETPVETSIDLRMFMRATRRSANERVAV